MRLKAFLLSFFILSGLLISHAQEGEYQRQKIWDKGIDEMLAMDRWQSPPENAVLFVGSSSLRMWTTINRDFPKLKFINRAFGGSEFEDLIYYTPRIVIPYKPRKIFVYEGDNDINSGKSPERVLAEFKKFVQIIKKELPKTKIYFISIKPSVSRLNLLPQMQLANALIEAETKKLKGVEYVDVASKMLDKDGQPLTDIFIEDNLHMNAKGYAIWRDVLAKYVY